MRGVGWLFEDLVIWLFGYLVRLRLRNLQSFASVCIILKNHNPVIPKSPQILVKTASPWDDTAHTTGSNPAQAPTKSRAFQVT